jgi:branched-subunit amino acid aminotransferase/4-amino-4-deoxychorismate lyase
VHGFVAETNSSNVFFVRGASLFTPLAEACLPGITRGIVLELCKEHGIACVERRVTPAEVWSADEMFTTGTLGELTPVIECDGRRIGSGARGPSTERLQRLYRERTDREGEPIPA